MDKKQWKRPVLDKNEFQAIMVAIVANEKDALNDIEVTTRLLNEAVTSDDRVLIRVWQESLDRKNKELDLLKSAHEKILTALLNE